MTINSSATDLGDLSALGYPALVNICTHLPDPELARMKEVCRELRNVVTDTPSLNNRLIAAAFIATANKNGVLFERAVSEVRSMIEMAKSGSLG